ncbi:WD repeat-containing protein 55 [Plakobranchus ocellatus]|uniref:WD repeat-containing protein 55 n=1 Tax=Plakobranchus ocellatus TaxID=259542 RepID=A0AAV4DU40_9GAST|nr:WD repeat-containing protein 55 [Plakobranchus ocellatus]
MAAPCMSQSQDAPDDIDLDDTVTTVQCHTTEDIIASGLISGDVILSSFSTTDCNRELKKFTHHKKACRTLRFSEDGRQLYSASKDKSLLSLDVETGKLKKRIKNAHESPIYSMVVTGDRFLATGDDEGVLKVWDMRTKEATVEMKECEDFISDMIVDDNKKLIIASRSPIYCMVVTGDRFLATGDDEGVLKVGAQCPNGRRSETAEDLGLRVCMGYENKRSKECEDFISDMIVDDNKKLIIASSGEGTLTAFNIRRKRMELQSELFDSELLCLAKMKV